MKKDEWQFFRTKNNRIALRDELEKLLTCLETVDAAS